MKTLVLCIAIFLTSVYPDQVSSLSNGAPAAACSTLAPDADQHGAVSQTSDAPYDIDLTPFCKDGTYSYEPDQVYTMCKTINYLF